MESIQKKFLCSELGVRRQTPYETMLAEIGLLPLQAEALFITIRYVARLQSLESSRLPKIVLDTTKEKGESLRAEYEAEVGPKAKLNELLAVVHLTKGNWRQVRDNMEEELWNLRKAFNEKVEKERELTLELADLKEYIVEEQQKAVVIAVANTERRRKVLKEKLDEERNLTKKLLKKVDGYQSIVADLTKEKNTLEDEMRKLTDKVEPVLSMYFVQEVNSSEIDLLKNLQEEIQQLAMDPSVVKARIGQLGQMVVRDLKTVRTSVEVTVSDIRRQLGVGVERVIGEVSSVGPLS